MSTFKSLLKSKNLVASLKTLFENVNIELQQQRLVECKDKTQQQIIRQVIIKSDTMALVDATVYIPIITYNQYQQELDALGENPIGDHFLYSKNYQRSKFNYCIPPQADSKIIISRCSEFTLDNKYKLSIEEGFYRKAMQLIFKDTSCTTLLKN